MEQELIKLKTNLLIVFACTSLLLRSRSRSAAMLFFTCCRALRSFLSELGSHKKRGRHQVLNKLSGIITFTEMIYLLYLIVGQRFVKLRAVIYVIL